MKIELVSDYKLKQAAEVHAESWRESHRSICSEEFIAIHTTERQMKYLQKHMEEGANIYLLSNNDKAVGIVSVQDNLIADLYVKPEEQRNGYGTRLLRYAVEKCHGTPVLWVLDRNRTAISLYEKCGFHKTGEKKILSPSLLELKMVYDE